MTTIALDGNGMVACDSRVTEGSTIVDDSANKHFVKSGIHFWLAGRDADADTLIAAVDGQVRDDYPDEISVYAIILKDGEFYTAGIAKDEGYFWQRERQGNHIAIGSGAAHALTAMDMGADAKQAVKMAIKRDTFSGGKVRTFKCR